MFRPLPTALLLMALFLLSCCLVWAQGNEALPEPQMNTTPAEPAGDTVNLPADSEAIWRDAQLMWVVAELALTPEQVQAIVPLLQEWQTGTVAARTQEEQVWQANQAVIETVLQAWIANVAPDTNAIAAANEMAQTVRTNEDAINAAYVTLEQQVLSLLNEDQLTFIESPQEEQLRAEIALFCDGFESIADFMVHLMEMHRELMPDEYNMVRLTSAARIALAVEHFENADYAFVEEDSLKMLDQAADWPDDRYEETLPKLPDAIRRRLNLQNDPIIRPISRSLFHHWLTDSRTALLLASWGKETAPPPEAVASETPWDNASEAADIIHLLHDMQIMVDQLNGIASLSSAAITEAQRIDAERAAIIAPVLTQLQQVVPYLLSGQQLTPEWLGFFRGLDYELKSVKRHQDRAVIPFINALRKLLSPQQAALVDWRVPPDVKGTMSPQELAENAREQASQMDEAIALCEVLRPFDPMTYLQVRLIRIENFMENYLDDNDPQWEEIRGKIADITLAARGVQPENWNAAAPSVALDILEAVGVTFDNDAWRPSNRPLSWNAIRNVLLSKQTTWVAEGMARATMATPQ